ncbi:MAG: HD domain-containing protein [Oscillospiraceae bacterium]|nr:HD domain-containing protein [Oscillospiraceae bacterium]
MSHHLEVTNLILANATYLRELELLNVLEQHRIFCKHDMAHFLDVARIAMLLCQEEQIPADPDVIYSAALLHDIGRTEEYQHHIPHDLASVHKAESILEEIACEETKKQKILNLIRHHRHPDHPNQDPALLESIFYRADKKSRLCFCCPACSQCNWTQDKKNMQIER